MPILLFALLIIVAYFYFKAKTKHLSDEDRQKAAKKWLLGGGLILLAFLAFTRGQVVIGAIASLIAVLMRGLPLLQYLPIFKKVVDEVQSPGKNQSDTSSQAMTRKQAADILGVSETAEEAEIVEAHKRLIQKIHPDKGGSEALAAQINQARKILLGLDN